MGFKLFLLIGFIGVVAFASESTEDASVETLSIGDETTKAVQGYKSCLAELTKSSPGKFADDISNECIDRTKIDTLIPLVNIGRWTEFDPEPTACINDNSKDVSKWTEESSRLMKKNATKDEVCDYLENTTSPAFCKIEKKCSSNADKQVLDFVLLTVYSIQQFYHEGRHTNFNCGDFSIKVNPVLYENGAKYSKDMSLLTLNLNCQ